jgi:putative endonuclease
MTARRVAPEDPPEAPVAPKSWSVYILRCANGALYTGIATDVARRLEEHASGTGRGAKALRGRQPLELLVAREVGAREMALRVEHRIKRLAPVRKAELARDAALLERFIAESAAPAIA